VHDRPSRPYPATSARHGAIFSARPPVGGTRTAFCTITSFGLEEILAGPPTDQVVPRTQEQPAVTPQTARPTSLHEVARRAADGEQTFDAALRKFLEFCYAHPEGAAGGDRPAAAAT